MASNNHLSRAEARRVEDWLLANRTTLESEDQGSYPDLARRVSIALAFPVTQSNVRSCADAVEVKIKLAGTTPLASFMLEVEKHRLLFASLEARLAAIEKKLGLPSVLPKAAGQPASIR